MNDEEKKAVESLKVISEYAGDNYLAKEHRRKFKMLIELVEKQSKEIEKSKQKEKQAYIKGTNDAHELCNKYWKDKIKAKIEELEKRQEDLRQMPDSVAKSLGIEDCQEKIILYKELLEEE
jgi:hypothetical protein